MCRFETIRKINFSSKFVLKLKITKQIRTTQFQFTFSLYLVAKRLHCTFFILTRYVLVFC
jgi:hypothetical protein